MTRMATSNLVRRQPTEIVPKFISPADPAARWTGAHGGQAFFAYSTNYLIVLRFSTFSTASTQSGRRGPTHTIGDALGRLARDAVFAGHDRSVRKYRSADLENRCHKLGARCLTVYR